MPIAFLKAEWRKLIMANYAVDSHVVRPYIPQGTELDFFNDTCYVSLVGFMFLNTRVLGIKIPFHVNFEEVNLRFYVRYKKGAEWRRGVVFIKEIVPRAALTLVANTIYKEHYETMPMKHRWDFSADTLTVEYQWKKDTWNSFSVIADNQPVNIREGSEEEFITEHYWGYTKQHQHTLQYGVEHPRWLIYPGQSHLIDVDFRNIYGDEFRFLQEQKPLSVFLAEGSPIIVRKGNRI